MRPILPPLAACLAVLAVAVLPARAAEDTPHTLSVTGQGEASAVPDQATLGAGVVTTGRTAADALAANARAMNQVFAALRRAGVAEKDIQTSGFGVEPQYTEATAKSPARLTGYRVTDNVSVRVDGLDRLGATLDALVASGANSIDAIGFGLKDPRPAMAEARAAAVDDAMARARALAKAAGVTLGPILSITDGYAGESQPISVAAFASGGLQDRALTPIARGENTASASVTITWEIH
ncbi:MAG TPA: SIMPL domain-containing protein [Rhizomicrobium sp.]|nr:SIMPL domain-containing protein [Rhizomicrobium sp.]